MGPATLDDLPFAPLWAQGVDGATLIRVSPCLRDKTLAAATTIKLGHAGARNPAAQRLLIRHLSTAASSQTLQVSYGTGNWKYLRQPTDCQLEGFMCAAHDAAEKGRPLSGVKAFVMSDVSVGRE